MGAKRVEYQIVGRYMDGKEVTAYHLQSIDTGKAGKYSREQVAYLVGRGQVTNCSGQIYQDRVLFRGVGCSLDDLPVQQEDGTLSRLSGVGHVRKGTSNEDAMTQVMLAGRIVRGRNVLGYIVKNAGGATATVNKDRLLELAKNGRIGNARVQNYAGKQILKGVNCNLQELPIYNEQGQLMSEAMA